MPLGFKFFPGMNYTFFSADIQTAEAKEGGEEKQVSKRLSRQMPARQLFNRQTAGQADFKSTTLTGSGTGLK